MASWVTRLQRYAIASDVLVESEMYISKFRGMSTRPIFKTLAIATVMSLEILLLYLLLLCGNASASTSFTYEAVNGDLRW